MILRRDLQKLNIIIALLIAVTLLVLPAAPVQAADPPVKLFFGAGGLTPWNIGPIQPGESGVKAVMVQNIGYKAGDLSIWLSNIVNADGTPAEFETQASGDPGELGDYLHLDPVSARITANATLPALVEDFPQSAGDSRYLRVLALAPGETVTIDWEWRLPAGTDNIVQGDSLAFDINYLLEDFSTAVPASPTPPSLAGDPNASGPVANPIRILEITWQDNNTGIGVDEGNRVKGTHTVTTMDGQVTVTISENSRILTDSEAEHIKIVVEERPERVTAPGGYLLLGKVYDIGAFTGEGERVSISFWPQFILRLKYDPSDLPPGTTNVYINTFDEELQQWIRLPKPDGWIDQPGEVVGLLSHLSLYAVIAETGESPAVPILPARFLVNSLHVRPRQVEVGDTVTITGDVVNTGGKEGVYNLPVRVSGLLQTVQKITLKQGEREEFSFSVKPDRPGTYQVEVGGRTASFVVEAAAPPIIPITPSDYRWAVWMVAICLALALLFWLIFWRRRGRTRDDMGI